MFSTRLRGIAVIVFIFVFAGGLAACDNPAEDDHDHDEHAEVEGLLLFIGGEEVVHVHEGEVEGSLTVPVDDETDEITVEFEGHDGEEVHADELDDEFSLGVVVQGAALVDVHEEGRWSFALHGGDEAGDTAIRVMLLHEGHSDFTTPDIPVTVE
ncbi:MAG: hypothetical protein F4Y00_05145 [Bacteroidetes bacterium SB0662_bin_6]|nr:hypothetical protein [Bacteroidetes bacterium SB0668_bin_1]MYE04341.1 hypothetical protein [Bacteroidetes bacterium SB0662_bin_6]